MPAVRAVEEPVLQLDVAVKVLLGEDSELGLGFVGSCLGSRGMPPLPVVVEYS